MSDDIYQGPKITPDEIVHLEQMTRLGEQPPRFMDKSLLNRFTEVDFAKLLEDIKQVPMSKALNHGDFHIKSIESHPSDTFVKLNNGSEVVFLSDGSSTTTPGIASLTKEDVEQFLENIKDTPVEQIDQKVTEFGLPQDYANALKSVSGCSDGFNDKSRSVEDYFECMLQSSKEAGTGEKAPVEQAASAESALKADQLAIPQ